MYRPAGRKEYEVKKRITDDAIEKMNQRFHVDHLMLGSFFLDTRDLRSDEIFLKLIRTTIGQPDRGWLPAYHFEILSLDGTYLGICDLRIGKNENSYYGGNIGYAIDKIHRGHHYAGKACQLLFQLAVKHGMEELIITCNPENIPSSRTCQWLGGELIEIAVLPEYNDMYLQGERRKCIYRFDLRTS